MSISEDSVIRAFHALQAASLALARNEGLLDAETLASFDQPAIEIWAPSVTLVVAALRAKGDPPAIELPSVEAQEPAVLGVLTIHNCPSALRPLLRRWSSLVPRIKSYNQLSIHELCRALVELPPSHPPLPEDMTALATSLRSLAIEISQRRSFQELFSGDLQAALDYESGRTGTPARTASYRPPPSYSLPSQTSVDADRVLQAIRETLYGALAEVLSTSSGLLAALSSDGADVDGRKPGAYFAAVALAILFVALNQVDAVTRTIHVVSLGNNFPSVVSDANCPPHLAGVIDALCSIAYAAKSLRDADDAEAVSRAVAGDHGDDAPTQIERLRQRLERGEGEESELSNAINALAVRVSRLPHFMASPRYSRYCVVYEQAISAVCLRTDEVHDEMRAGDTAIERRHVRIESTAFAALIPNGSIDLFTFNQRDEMSTFAGPLGLLEGGIDDVWCDQFSVKNAGCGSRPRDKESLVHNALRIAPSCFLLSHAHCDHLKGLDQLHNCKIYAHRETIAYLKGYHDAHERRKHQADLCATGRPAFKYKAAIEHNKFIPVEYDKAYWLDTMDKKKTPVRMVPIDAGHCPGSCLFLLERFTPDKERIDRAILYCGDQRCDSDYLNKLHASKWLEPYLKTDQICSLRTLDKLVLDTSAILSASEVLTKAEAITSVVNIIRSYPPTTKFFINAWTTGYEEMLLAIAQAFGTKIHVDFFKENYMRSGVLGHHITRVAGATRFHACEKTWKCDEVWANGRGSCAAFAAGLSGNTGTKRKRYVGCGCQSDDPLHAGTSCRRLDATEGLTVYINPVEPLQRERFFAYERLVTEKITEALQSKDHTRLPLYLLAPFGRHSALPELRRFVQLFKPLEVEPNTIYDQDTCLDYVHLAEYLGSDALGAGAAKRMAEAAEAEIRARAVRKCKPFSAPTLQARAGSTASVLAAGLQLADAEPAATVLRTAHVVAGRPLLDNLEGSPALQATITDMLSIDTASVQVDYIEQMRGFIKQSVLCRREHAPAALQADLPLCGNTWGVAQPSKAPMVAVTAASHTLPALKGSRLIGKTARPAKRSPCTFALEDEPMTTALAPCIDDSSPLSRRSRTGSQDLWVSPPGLQPRTVHQDMREAIMATSSVMTERERKRFRSNIARSFRRLLKEHESRRIQKLAVKISEGDLLPSMAIDSQSL